MKARIAGLIVLAILAGASLYLSSFWVSQTNTVNRVVREQANYRSTVWLVASAIFAAAWIWLLVKTIRYRAEYEAEDYQ